MNKMFENKIDKMEKKTIINKIVVAKHKFRKLERCIKHTT